MLTELAINAQADALARLLDGGTLRIYEADKLLAEPRLAPIAAPPAVDGLLTFNSIAADTNARATGQPTRFVALAPDETPVIEGTAGEGGELRLGRVRVHAVVLIERFTHTVRP